MYRLTYAKQAKKDYEYLKAARLQRKTDEILDLLIEDPLRRDVSFKALSGEHTGLYSRRINIKHRIVYEVLPEYNEVHVIRMWTHYDL